MDFVQAQRTTSDDDGTRDHDDKNDNDEFQAEMSAPVLGIDLGTTRTCFGVWDSERERVKVISAVEDVVDERDGEGDDDDDSEVNDSKSTSRRDRSNDQANRRQRRIKTRLVPSVVSFTNGRTSTSRSSSSVSYHLNTIRHLLFGRTVARERAPSERHTVVGSAAAERLTTHPRQTIYAVKRLIGRLYEDEQVQNERAALTYAVVSNEEGRACVKVRRRGDDRVYTPVEVSAKILRFVREQAERYLRKSVTCAVVTVPAHFTDQQRAATRDAGDLAGMHVRVLSEPVAAAMAYGLHAVGKKLVLVFDLGGGTFDLSLMSVDEGEVRVLATDGDAHLGGEDFDNRLVELCAKRVAEKLGSGVDLLANKHMLARVKIECERAKRELSDREKTVISVPSLQNGFDLSVAITRAEFETLITPYLEQCRCRIDEVLGEADVRPTQIDEVVLVGGSSRVPAVRSLVSNYFEGKELCRSIDPDVVVAHGAAVQGAVYAGVASDELTRKLIVDVVPFDVGVEDADGRMAVVFERCTPFPCRATRIYTTNKDSQSHITLHMYEGHSDIARVNEYLGTVEFVIQSWQGARAGERQVEVTFQMNADGLLNVRAETLDMENDTSVSGAAPNRWVVILLSVYAALLFIGYVYLRVINPELMPLPKARPKGALPE